MLAWLAASVVLAQSTAQIDRDDYGVPRITAPTLNEAFKAMGQAVAEDRLWQMELSRRSSQGQLAEVLGAGAVASDTEVLKRAYTADEYRQMFGQLPEKIRGAFQSYADGVNAVINRRKADGSLPPGYAANGIQPRPWTVTDSCAIAVMMSRRFGGGGAGELRNYAVLQYLNLRPLRNQALDVFDDLLWFNDPDSPTTVSRTDDPVAVRPIFVEPTRADTERHLNSLPKTSLLELAGAVAMAGYEDSALIAEENGVLYKTGSYAVVVGPRRSATGNPLLLSAPQMGHTAPSVVHEVGIKTPNLQVSGMDVPGIPGVLIGMTPDMAWGLTTAVADIEDVFVSTLQEGNTYTHAGQTRELEEIKFTIKVKGEEDREVTQYRTVHGPVMLLSRSSKAVYSLKSSYWMRELASYAAMFDMAEAKTVADVNQFARRVPVAFNFFFALKTGEIGFRYMGYVPVRAEGVDPRLPTLDTVSNQWKGFIPNTQMPKVDDPASGLITNWNNKPVWWWPNQDTPAWGALFRSAELSTALTQDKLAIHDLEKAAWTIARRETASNSGFMPLFRLALEKEFGRATAPEPARQLMGYQGWQTEGSVPAQIYDETVRQLRRVIYLESLGNLTQDALFEQAVQPSVMLRTLQGRTKFKWLGERSADEVILKAYEQAVARLEQSRGADLAGWGYRPGTMPDPSGPRIPYNDRGTYIQLTELAKSGLRARSVVSPGVAEMGPHMADQAPLARAWTYKPVWNWKSAPDSR